MRRESILQTYGGPPPRSLLRRARARAQACLAPGGCSASPPLRRIAVVGMDRVPRRVRISVSWRARLWPWASGQGLARSDEVQRWGWIRPLGGCGSLAGQARHRCTHRRVWAAPTSHQSWTAEVACVVGGGAPGYAKGRSQLLTNLRYVKLTCGGTRRRVSLQLVESLTVRFPSNFT